MKINYPYLVVSDIHFKNWTFGSHTTADRINSRLQQTIDAVLESAKALKEIGGRDIIITGDMFHDRGTIEPSVFNPVKDLFVALSEQGFCVYAIPGNHDLESEDSNSLFNAFEAFTEIKNFNIFYDVTNISLGDGFALFIPWDEKIRGKIAIDRINSILDNAITDNDITIFCHIGLSNVVSGIGEAVDPEIFNKKGIKRVFAGHFHNHKHFPFEYTDVYSVGALTHQSFRDVDSLAGFVLVAENGVQHCITEAPKFVDLKLDDLVAVIDGDPESINKTLYADNFVRIPSNLSGITHQQTIDVKETLENIGSLKVISRIASYIDNTTTAKQNLVSSDIFKKTKLKDQISEYVSIKYSSDISKKVLDILSKEDFNE